MIELLFFNDHDERAARLRALIAALAEIGSAEAWELADGADTPRDGNRIELQVVLDILDSSDDTQRRIEELDDLGHR